MNKLLKRILASTVLTTALLVPVAVTAMASANHTDIHKNLCEGVSLSLSGSGCEENDEEAKNQLNSIIKKVIAIFSLIVGIVSVIMIIIAGLKYVTSGGDSTKVTSAKDTILYAVVGLVVVALSQFIVQFVLGEIK